MHNGWDHAFSGEAVQRPEQDGIEGAGLGIPEQGRELLAVGVPAAVVIDVFADDGVAVSGAPRPQFAELVFRVLAFVVCGDTGVDRKSSHPAPFCSTFLRISSTTSRAASRSNEPARRATISPLRERSDFIPAALSLACSLSGSRNLNCRSLTRGFRSVIS